ncbi:MAG: hypothetical protein WCK10_00795 [Candidatus Staskawiczbacteria bacterium]
MIEDLQNNNQNILNANNNPNILEAPQSPQPTQTEIEETSPTKELENILTKIDKASKAENKKLEDSLYIKAQELFKNFTGQDLIERAELAAKEEVKIEGSKIYSKDELLSKIKFDKEAEEFRFTQQNNSVQKSWQMLSDEERKLFLNDINNFISAIEKKIEELKKDGFSFSKEIFYNLTANGYMLLNLKKSIWDGKILIPVMMGPGAYKFKRISIRDFEDFLIMSQKLFDSILDQAITEKIRKDISHSAKRWDERKIRKVKEILKAVSKNIKDQELKEEEKIAIRKKLEEQIKTKIKSEVEAEERASLEKLSNIGEVGALERLRDFEKLEKKTDKNIERDIQKIEKSLKKDIEQRTEEEKKIATIMKKQMEKGKISKKRISYLKKVTNDETKPDEDNSSSLIEENIPQLEDKNTIIENTPPVVESIPPAE